MSNTEVQEIFENFAFLLYSYCIFILKLNLDWGLRRKTEYQSQLCNFFVPGFFLTQGHFIDRMRTTAKHH